MVYIVCPDLSVRKLRNITVCTCICFYMNRSVREEERCFALGMQFVILRLFGKYMSVKYLYTFQMTIA